jgi:hypothetical protein
MTFRSHCNIAFLSCSVLVGSFATVAAADLVVIDARGIALRAGQMVDSAKPLALKQGQHVTLISPAGLTIKLDGPYNRAPEADQARGVPVINTLALLVNQRQIRVGEVGTTRGLAPNTLPDPWLLDASRAGTFCLREGEVAVFWRPSAASDADLVVVPTDRSWKANAHWSAGSDRIEIEAPAVIRAGATYVVTLNGAESAVKVENVPAMLANDQMRTAWLAGKGCEAQAEALLRSAK